MVEASSLGINGENEDLFSFTDGNVHDCSLLYYSVVEVVAAERKIERILFYDDANRWAQLSGFTFTSSSVGTSSVDCSYAAAVIVKVVPYYFPLLYLAKACSERQRSSGCCSMDLRASEAESDVA